MPKGFTDQENDLIRKRLIDQGYKLFLYLWIKKNQYRGDRKSSRDFKRCVLQFLCIKRNAVYGCH